MMTSGLLLAYIFIRIVYYTNDGIYRIRIGKWSVVFITVIILNLSMSCIIDISQRKQCNLRDKNDVSQIIISTIYMHV